MASARRTTGPVRAACWYCEAQGVTAEHVLARSLSGLFGDERILRHDYVHPEHGTRRPPKRARYFAIKARRFCKGCNGGWMNQIDQTVRPVLAAFATGTPTSLDAVQQQTLSTWTVKTVMGYQSIEPDDLRFAPRSMYREFGRVHAPPAQAQIWVGANTHGQPAWQGSHSLLFGDAPHQRGFGSTLSFGYGVLHLIQHADDGTMLRLRGYTAQALGQIWPPEHPAIDWPPARRFPDHDLTALAYEINANSERVHRVSGGTDGSL